MSPGFAWGMHGPNAKMCLLRVSTIPWTSKVRVQKLSFGHLRTKDMMIEWHGNHTIRYYQSLDSWRSRCLTYRIFINIYTLR